MISQPLGHYRIVEKLGDAGWVRCTGRTKSRWTGFVLRLTGTGFIQVGLNIKLDRHQMPTWFIILMGSLFVVGAIGISVGVVVARRILSKVDKLFAETKRDDALVHDKCMIRDGAIHCPGVIQVVGGTLIIQTVFDKRREIPLSQVILRKEASGIGRAGWWGKTVFLLDTPETSNLAIGVKNPEPWREVFGKKQGLRGAV